MKDRLLAMLLCFGAALVVCTEAVAADVPPEITRRISRLADELNSPFCPGKTLLNCTSYQAYELRGEMQQLAISGLSDEEIVAKVQLRYSVRLDNPDQPWMSSVAPVLPFLFGGMLVLFAMKRWKDHARAAPADTGPVSDEDAERLALIRAMVADPEEE